MANLNAVRRPNSKKFTRGFLVVSPGLTIKDRLRVLQPNDPDSYYASRELVPSDMMNDLERVKIVNTNYHAFKLRERLEISKGGRLLLQGRGGDELNTLETEGQMIQRVMPDLMGMKNILVINDEAHHCYREKRKQDDDGEDDVSDLKGDEKKRQNKTARPPACGYPASRPSTGNSAWRGCLTFRQRPFLERFRLRRGHLVPLDYERFFADGCHRMRDRKAAACAGGRQHSGRGNAKVPQLVGAHRQTDAEKGRGQAKTLDPLSIPVELQTALEALYGHYEKTYNLWAEKASRCRRALSSSATTPRPPSWFMTSSPVLFSKMKTAPVSQ